MLVLSRRPGQKVIFPGLGISIEILRTQGSAARLGIDAPVDIEVVREEVLNRRDRKSTNTVAVSEPEGESHRRHELNNQLNALTLKLQLLQRQLQLGKAVEPNSKIADIVSALSALEVSTPDTSEMDMMPRVLIVEDQANERELLADCLRLSGIQAVTAADGRDAFNYLQDNEPPDLVLLDMRMPELDGPSLIRLIRDDLRLQKLRVFAVSALGRDEFGSSLPVDGWLSKPVRMDSILEAVKDCSRTTFTTA